MAHSRWTVTPYAAGLAAVLALGACSGGGGAPAATPAGPSASAVTTTAAAPTTSTAPTTKVDPVLARIPAAARPETQAGAEAFGSFFLASVNTAFTRPDSSALDGLFKSTCKVCIEMQLSALDLERTGEHHSGLSVEVSASSVRDYSASSKTVLLWTTQHSVPVLDKRGATVRTTTGGKGVFLATLSYDGRWYVDRLQVVK